MLKARIAAGLLLLLAAGCGGSGAEEVAEEITDAVPTQVPSEVEEAVEEATEALEDSAAALPTQECGAAFAEAAAVDDMQDTVDDLIPAIEACVSVEDWTAASGANPAALDDVDPLTFLENACANLDVEGLCAEVTES